MEGRFKREGTYVYLWLIYVDIWHKSTKYCKAIILQLKINKILKRDAYSYVLFGYQQVQSIQER